MPPSDMSINYNGSSGGFNLETSLKLSISRPNISSPQSTGTGTNVAKKLWRRITKSPAAFKYPPLSDKHIRTLTLQPGASDAPLVISLESQDLRKARFTYEALSYVWGSSDRNIGIECNGCELKITPSLEIAMRRLRFETDQRVLWIDAISINQDDAEERAQQVPLMREIFPSASKVVIWVGEADKNSSLAMRTIATWAAFNRANSALSDAIRYSKFEERFSKVSGYDATLKATGAFTHRPWFSRCWTFQEVLLAGDAELLCGDQSLTWDSFYYALEAFPIHLLATDTLNFNALFMCHGRSKTLNTDYSTSIDLQSAISKDLSRLLQITRNFEVSDPRDKIFSLLGVAKLNDTSLFKPTYTDSVRDTYVKFTLAMMKDENNLHVLLSVGENERDPELPSWVPDWRCRKGVTLIGYYDYIEYSVSAGVNQNFSALSTSSPDYTLPLTGATLDTIKEVYDLADLAAELKAMKSWRFTPILTKYAQKFGIERRLLRDGCTPEAALLRTLTADRWFFGAHLHASYKERWFPMHLRFSTKDGDALVRSVTFSSSIRAKNAAFVVTQEQKPSHLDYEVDSPFTHSVIDTAYEKASPVYAPPETAINIQERELQMIAKEAVAQALLFLKDKRLYVTERGYVGVGSCDAKKGDMLAALFGSEVPFVLRRDGGRTTRGSKEGHLGSRGRIGTGSKKGERERRDDRSDGDGERWRLVGECYIDGIMYGEVFKVSRDGVGVEPYVDWVKMRKFTII